MSIKFESFEIGVNGTGDVDRVDGGVEEGDPDMDDFVCKDDGVNEKSLNGFDDIGLDERAPTGVAEDDCSDLVFEA